MRRREYQLMHDAEDRLWWYKGMENISRAVIEAHCLRGAPLRILDAGCGTGGGMRFLRDYGTVTGLDFSPWAIELAGRRGEQALVRGSVVSLPFGANQFDLVTSFDVLCTVGPNAQQALTEFYQVLSAGGSLFLRLPAYDWLRGAHDRAVDIHRRYTTATLAAQLKRAGFSVEHLGYANCWLFPVAVAKRWSERLLPAQNGSDLTLNPGRLNSILTLILSSEARRIARHGMPFGLTVIAVASKR
jgi:SAM-dependent methyltransferase